MKKFTVFTIILAIVVVVVASEIVKDKNASLEEAKLALPSGLDLASLGQANVLGADDSAQIDGLDNKLGQDLEELTDETAISQDLYDEAIPFESGSVEESSDEFSASDIEKSTNSAKAPEGNDSGLADFEDQNYSFGPKFAPTVYISNDQVKAAGFTDAYIEKAESNGFLFKTIYVGDLFDVEFDQYLVRTDEALMAKIYIFRVGGNSAPTEVYNAIRVRAEDNENVKTNETDEFGDNSYYVNDENRLNTTFLLVRFGSTLYGFSYPKDYHSQIKNLLKLISWEMK